MKHLFYIIEVIVLYILLGVFKILPLDTASALGGWIGRVFGPIFGGEKKARKNLERAFPDLPKTEHDKILRGMWDHLGRVFAEYPHLRKIGAVRVTVKGGDILSNVLSGDQGGAFCGGHLGNWESNVAFLWMQHNVPTHITYRALNNPYADRLLSRIRTFNGKMPAYPKSRESGKHLIQALKDKQFLGILIDQKYNEGIAVPFFGQPAMTNPVFVQLTQKYKAPLVMIRSKRLKGANFELTIHPPLDLFDEGNKPLPLEDVMGNAHTLLENWIKDTPQQWLWLHRRWDSKALKQP